MRANSLEGKRGEGGSDCPRPPLRLSRPLSSPLSLLPFPWLDRRAKLHPLLVESAKENCFTFADTPMRFVPFCDQPLRCTARAASYTRLLRTMRNAQHWHITRYSFVDEYYFVGNTILQKETSYSKRVCPREKWRKLALYRPAMLFTNTHIDTTQ